MGVARIPRIADGRSAEAVVRGLRSERTASEHSSLPPIFYPASFLPVKKFGLPALSARRLPTSPLASQLTATARWKTPTCASSPIPSKFKPGARAFDLNEQPTNTPRRPPQSSMRARCPQPEAMQSPACVAVPEFLLSKFVISQRSNRPASTFCTRKSESATFFRSTTIYSA